MRSWGHVIPARHRFALITFSPILLLLALIVFFPPDGKSRAEWLQFVGRFHPLAVHLPIALMLLVPVLEIAGRWQRFSYLRLSSRFVLGFATITAVSAAYLGWCLARSGSYSGSIMTQHMWGGITLATISWVCWMLSGRVTAPRVHNFYVAALIAGVLIVSFTGYRGGQISQGEEHLTEYMPAVLRHAIGLPDKEPLIQAAAGSFYLERVQPIFADRCVNCHGRSKQKSGLRLDSYGWLMRGGKHGAAVKAGNAQGSDLVRRITLSPEQDDFMPKEKKQPLSPEQVKIIEAWIGAGASGELPVEAIKLPAGGAVAPAPKEVSFPEVNEAAVAKQRQGFASALAKLQSRYPGILIYESRNSADLALNASLLGPKFGDDDVAAFAAVAEHITSADFSRTGITDHSAPTIAAMKHLRTLRLANTKITDATLKAIGGIDQLQSLNVYATGVTSAALPLVEKFPKLEHFYAGQTAIQSTASVLPGLAGKLVIDIPQRDSKK